MNGQTTDFPPCAAHRTTHPRRAPTIPAAGRLYLSLEDGSLVCMAPAR
jgi:hypothetical protein